MRRVLAAYPGDRLLIGEIYLPVKRLVRYYGPDLTGMHLPFNFNMIFVDWNPAELLRLIREYESLLPPGGWPNWVLGNHDQPRVATRFGPAQARVAMVLLMTLRGTPTLYQGDELALENVPIPPERRRDPFGTNRDAERTPMPWTDTASAGFTTGEPWLPVGADHPAKSVATQRLDSGSMLNFTRELLALRRQEPALSLGDWAPLAVEGDVLAYVRSRGERRCGVVLNLESAPKAIRFEQRARGTILLSTRGGRPGEAVRDHINLGADEALIIGLE
jgi:alpha-glucosidase